jgi:hypothetical protein
VRHAGFYLGVDPSEVSICAGQPPSTVNAGSIAGFTDLVDMSPAGNPGGTTATFVLDW